ncbi:hypothetical protein AAFA46_08375 [Oscillospiraceae bacterium WX1]
MRTHNFNYLNKAYQTGGPHLLRRVFNDTVRHDKQEALNQLDDDSLLFPVFFLLLRDVAAHDMSGDLNGRNAIAYGLCADKIKNLPGPRMAPDAADEDALALTLRWILETGKNEPTDPILRNEFDAVIDYAAALLIIKFDDKTALPLVADLIFRRNRQGLLIHDLVWSFFQTLDTATLLHIADNLLSSNPKDAALAQKLLHVEAADPGEDKRALHRRVTDWIRENGPYLYLTGEHLQQITNPVHLRCDREAKYLNKEISPRYRAPLEPLSTAERACLSRYREANDDEQQILTDYSYQLRGRDTRLWDVWLQKETAEQVIAAGERMEAI